MVASQLEPAHQDIWTGLPSRRLWDWISPILVQYGNWIERLVVHGDFGTDIWTKDSVLKEIGKRWPVTVELAILALIVSPTYSVAIGIFSRYGRYLGRLYSPKFCDIVHRRT